MTGTINIAKNSVIKVPYPQTPPYTVCHRRTGCVKCGDRSTYWGTAQENANTSSYAHLVTILPVFKMNYLSDTFRCKHSRSSVTKEKQKNHNAVVSTAL